MSTHSQMRLNLTHWSFHPDQGALWPGFQVQKPVFRKKKKPAWWADSVLHLEGMELVAAAKPLTPKWVTSAYRAHSKSCWSKPENLFSGSEVEQAKPSEQCKKPAAVRGGGEVAVHRIKKNKANVLCGFLTNRVCRRSPARWWRWQWRRAVGTGGSGGNTSACPSRRAGSRRPRSGRNACTGPAPSRPGGSLSAACAGHWRWPVGNCWSACCSSERKEGRRRNPG